MQISAKLIHRVVITNIGTRHDLMFHTGDTLADFLTLHMLHVTQHTQFTEVLNELESFAADGMNEEEYDFMRSAIGQRDALQYETPGRKLGLLGNILRYDLPLNYRTQQNSILKETDREVLNTLANKLIQPENMAIVVVGDEATIREELEGLGMPIKMLDEDGFEIKTNPR